MMPICSVPRCSRSYYAMNFCRMHYHRNLRHGDPLIDKRTTHGKSKRPGKTPEYVAWLAMKSRCSATSGPDFETYGANGIGICERWLNFENFLADMGPRPSPGHSVGRKDNNSGYSPDNCRWETSKQQQTNTRVSKLWTVDGVTFDSCRDAAKAIAVDQKTIRVWVKAGKEGCHAVRKY